jgi:hypothetical protein
MRNAMGILRAVSSALVLYVLITFSICTASAEVESSVEEPLSYDVLKDAIELTEQFVEAPGEPAFPQTPEEWKDNERDANKIIDRIKDFLRRLREKGLDRWEHWLKYDTDGDGKLSIDELRAMFKDKVSCGGLFDLLTCEKRDQLAKEFANTLACFGVIAQPSGFPDPNACGLTAEKFGKLLDETINRYETLIGTLNCGGVTDSKSKKICERIERILRDAIERLKKFKEELILVSGSAQTRLAEAPAWEAVEE